MSKQRTITVVGRYENISQLCDFIETAATAAGLSFHSTFYVRLACDEACTNIIEHAYGGEDLGTITASWEIIQNNFVITLLDHGKPFSPETVEKPHISTETGQIENLKAGGLGLHLIEQVMDGFSFHFEPEGNTMIMVKELPETL